MAHSLGQMMLHFDFNLPPSEAIAYLQSKKPEVLNELSTLKHNIYNRVFTIKGIANVDLLSDMQKSLSLALLQGQEFKEWKQNVQSLLTQSNTPLNPKRLKQIYHQNILNSYNQGRKMTQDNLKGEIYYRYVAINDSRTRLSHKLLHNTILPREHSFWEKHYPGADFGCRCRVEAYTKRQLDRFGLKVSNISDMPNVQEATFDISDNNAALAHILNQKLKIHANNPNAITRLKAIAGFIQQRNVRFKEINELWQVSAIKQERSVDSKNIIIAKATAKLQGELDTKAEHILLSGWTLRTHTHHNNVDSFDYSLVEEMLGSEYRVRHSRERHIVYFSKLGHYYKAVFKVTENKKEIFLVSLSKSSENIKY
ncbi:phage minor head protein [Helicobacter ganmani]|uniref:phage head morphogenesis protein n=1 Tax=Helicobacter ganmani TaxID=60246 RepID=UPI003A88A06F